MSEKYFVGDRFETLAIQQTHYFWQRPPTEWSNGSFPSLVSNQFKSITENSCGHVRQRLKVHNDPALPAKISLLHWLSITWQSPSSLVGALVSSSSLSLRGGRVVNWQPATPFIHSIKFRWITRIYPVRLWVSGISTITNSVSQMFIQLLT